jgi:hypothetical protein
MMKSLRSLLSGAIVLAVVSCHSENPFISKEQADKLLNKGKPKPVEYIAAIINEDVYWIRHFDDKPKKIPSNVVGPKTQVRMKHDHSKIAFVAFGGDVIITDTLGSYITVKTSSAIQQLDWTRDDKTLWMLINNKFAYYGTTIALPALEKQVDERILSAAVTPGKDVFYIVQTPLGLGSFTERLEFRGHNGTERTIHKQPGEIRHMADARLSKDGNNFVLGYTRSPFETDLLKIEIYSFDKNSPDYTDETVRHFDSVYDFNSNYIVTLRADNSFNGDFYLAAEYTRNEAFGEDHSQYKSDFNGILGTIYVDWK